MRKTIGLTLFLVLLAGPAIADQIILTRGGEYRVNFDSSLVTDVTRRIGWQLTLSDRYLSNPPFGFEKNDLILTTGLKIKLGELK